MWESGRHQQNLSARFNELQQELQQGAIARAYLQSQLEWVLYRLEQLNPEFIATTLLRLEEKIGALPDQTPAISEVGMDYRQLTKLLETGKWRKADEHTWEILLQIAVREDEGWLSAADIDSLPPTDLRTIDKLWQQPSSGRFGLTVRTTTDLGKYRPKLYPIVRSSRLASQGKLEILQRALRRAKMLPPDTSPLPPGDIGLVTVAVNSPQQKTLPALSGDLLRAIANHPK